MHLQFLIIQKVLHSFYQIQFDTKINLVNQIIPPAYFCLNFDSSLNLIFSLCVQLNLSPHSYSNSTYKYLTETSCAIFLHNCEIDLLLKCPDFVKQKTVSFYANCSLNNIYLKRYIHYTNFL